MFAFRPGQEPSEWIKKNAGKKTAADNPSLNNNIPSGGGGGGNAIKSGGGGGGGNAIKSGGGGGNTIKSGGGGNAIKSSSQPSSGGLGERKPAAHLQSKSSEYQDTIAAGIIIIFICFDWSTKQQQHSL